MRLLSMSVGLSDVTSDALSRCDLVLWHFSEMPEQPDESAHGGKAEVAFQGREDRF
jgi:hypothetical protein